MPTKILKIAAATPGMVLAEAVLDARGNVLVRRGVTLTEGSLKSLESRGIDRVVIEEAGEEAAAPVVGGSTGNLPSAVEQALAEKNKRIDVMFAGLGENTLMAALAEAAKRHARRKLVGEGR